MVKMKRFVDNNSFHLRILGAVFLGYMLCVPIFGW